MPDPYNVDDLLGGILEGSRPHVARAITLVESKLPAHRERARELLKRLAARDQHNTIRLGISGVPGAGKSTFTDALGVRLVDDGHKVGVLAVDPSSSRTGGSILGDRTRMANLASRENAYIRPSPSGNHLGGVARATRESMLVLEGAGFDVIIVETVGVGQSEVAVSGMVDTFLLLGLARAGDQLQGIKRGILEMVDLIGINKADGDGEGPARVAAREMRIAMKLISSATEDRIPEVIPCSAYTGLGLDELWQAVLRHREGLEKSGGIGERRAQQQVDWLWSMADEEVRSSLRSSPAVGAIRADLEQQIATGHLSALEGVGQVLDAWRSDVVDGHAGQLRL
ncbi:methylmalonyl Co-A mutase-associated GTPase MeaB [Propionibacteriaceae bacterium G1746]|uniref:methylmalonyl Co-A mutase-associated GTPase MeaB n=1 Tax=Aestuariimicrobium sp. G57 TaxID=3418485 RepID=UPI003C14793C